MVYVDDGSEDGALGMFEEPAGYYQPEKQPTTVSHRTMNGQELILRLIGLSPLWFTKAVLWETKRHTHGFGLKNDDEQTDTTKGHLLWNAGRTVADYLETNASSLIQGKTVLELGAGAGLPSLICAMNDARQVVVTDYPEADLIENLRHNISTCSQLSSRSNICAEGYLWGAPTNVLSSHLPATQHGQAFDLLILADLLFNHSEHSKLISTVQQTLKRSPNAQALVFFTPYRPWLLQKDIAFFGLAREGGFMVEHIFEHVLEKVMFEEDPGDELLRRTVFGYRLTWAPS
ncbi:Protein N-terminal and lysine N-methyltransferase efm7 [Vermiconidia calcicola]|uniref:Protein N-terminal and lysine N-methyltransferase efm7 n=1 Tax=Vermiconidia calcicola TaxID=1690605 RepID=A0ACC3MC91_9PEZI|nr:Protein N-terminal and lysine N-methyltransferase efm7 [Vermiconidia calcicola]